MQTDLKRTLGSKGISVITCTNRQGYVDNLFQNFIRQRHPKKELIIICNSNRISLSRYQQFASKHKNIRVFHMPEHISLGACLNFAVKQANYSYIAKLDDDDYYSPYYLTDSLHTLIQMKADVVGKRAHYMYLRGSKTLLLRFPRDEYRSVNLLPGATLMFKRSVFNRVQFPDRSVGEDDLFCQTSKKKGFKVYSAGRFNFIAIRRKNSYKHTWIISDNVLIQHHQKINNVKSIKSYIERKPKVGMNHDNQ